jgi:hypothetical protein
MGLRALAAFCAVLAWSGRAGALSLPRVTDLEHALTHVKDQVLNVLECNLCKVRRCMERKAVPVLACPVLNYPRRCCPLQTPRLGGIVADCGTDFETVDAATQSVLLPTLKGLQDRTFFSFFKVDLSQECPFWDENFECHNEFCAVCECDQAQIPSKWIEEDNGRKAAALLAVDDVVGATTEVCQERAREEKHCADSALVESNLGKLDTRNNSAAGEWQEFAPGRSSKAAMPWTELPEDEARMSYVNLKLNPERFTGYR